MAVELGRIRTANGLTVREVAAASPIPRSTLNNYETAVSPLPLHAARVLDELYGTGEWIQEALRRLDSWSPWQNDQPLQYFSKRWDAAYGGPVTVHVVPEEASVGIAHEIRLQWGPFALERTLHRMGSSGVVLSTNKSEEDESIACQVWIEPRAFVKFGYEPDDRFSSLVISVDDEWYDPSVPR